MMKKFNSDLKKYKEYSGKPTIILFFTQQALWAIFIYRISNGIYKSKLPGFFRKILLYLCVLHQKIVEIITGISLPYSAEIGEKFYIGHFGGIIINSKAVIGENCNISQGVTIGVSGRGEKRGVPILGNDIYVGANAVIAGAIHIGDNAVIAANSLVVENVPNNVTVLGVPAKKVSDNNSEFYI